MPINVQSGEIPTLPNATSYQLKIQKKYEDYLEKLNSTSGGLPTQHVRSPLRSPRVKKKSNSPLKKNVGIKSSLYAPVRDGSSVNSYNNNVMIPQKAQKISSSVYGSLASNLDHDDTQAETKSILSSNYKQSRKNSKPISQKRSKKKIQFKNVTETASANSSPSRKRKNYLNGGNSPKINKKIQIEDPQT